MAGALPEPTEGSAILIVIEDRYELAAALLGVWAAGHRAVLPASNRRDDVVPLLGDPSVVTLLHDTPVRRGAKIDEILAQSREAAKGEAVRRLSVGEVDGGGHVLRDQLLAPLLDGGAFDRAPLEFPGRPAVPWEERKRELEWTVSPIEVGPGAFEIEIPARYGFFHGHFPGYPILPGVVQLHELVLPQLRRTWPDLGASKQLVRLKFTGRIEPGDRVRLDLNRDGDAVAFSLTRDGAPCASGTLKF